MRIEPDLIGDAIAALTAAALGTRTIGMGTPNERSEPVDFGEIACHVLTAVAANVGGVEELLAGRPGSWEAGYVRQMVLSTAGESAEELLRWRTLPVAVASAMGLERRTAPDVAAPLTGRERVERSPASPRDVDGGRGGVTGSSR